MLRPKHEVAEILDHYLPAFLARHRTSGQVLRTLGALQVCRTAALGGHKKTCTACGREQISYNSCRNRHCPKCQAVVRERWISQRKAELLEVPYFHVVFTLPHELNSLVIKHPKAAYTALFRANWQTIHQFASDAKHLGAKTGMTAVLHTWGQQLALHPHLHCIVPAGGIDAKGNWMYLKNSRKKARRKSKYLFPQKALSRVFRAKFMAEFRKQYPIPQVIAKAVWQKDWVVYAKRPFAGPGQVIEYLGRYTHKIAISNHRLEHVDQAKVGFRYKDYASGGTTKTMTLSAVEFIRRFSQHVLPHGFIRIRHYGILASRNKAKELNQAKACFGLPSWEKQRTIWQQIAQEHLGIEPDQCPGCKGNTLRIIQVLEPQRGPPAHKLPSDVTF